VAEVIHCKDSRLAVLDYERYSMCAFLKQ